jgi:hypothetical protein
MTLAGGFLNGTLSKTLPNQKAAMGLKMMPPYAVNRSVRMTSCCFPRFSTACWAMMSPLRGFEFEHGFDSESRSMSS